MDNFELINKPCNEIKKELLFFENELKKIINDNHNFLTEDLNAFLFTNPKRLRPRFIFLFSKLLKINSNLITDIALVTELIHCASLIHDDILDDDKTRRKLPTLHAKYDSKIAVLAGDFLLSLALEKLSFTNLKTTQIFSQKIKKTIQGEISQNESINKIADFDSYIKKTFDKTGNLFLAGIESLFTIQEIDKNLKENIVNFMTNFSIAFQIKNDIDNFKTNISDYKNGNYTLPMIYFECEKTSNGDNLLNCIEKYSKKAFEKVEFYQNKAIEFLKEINNAEQIIELSKIVLRSY